MIAEPIPDTLVRGRTLFGIHHPSRRTCIRLLMQRNGVIVDVTAGVAKIIKMKMTKVVWMDVPGRGQNPVFHAAELYAKAVGREKQPFQDLH